MNIIDDGFKDYISKVKPPDNNDKWLDYIGVMWANVYSAGITFTLKSMEAEFKKVEDEKV